MDFYSPSGAADTSGWKGPADVLGNVLAEGNVQIQWKGQRLVRRIGDVRRFIDFSALVFGVLQSTESSVSKVFTVVQRQVESMRPQHYLRIGFIQDSGTWTPTQVVQQHKDVALALQVLISNVLHVKGVVSTRIGRPIKRFPEAKGYVVTTTIWWRRSLETCCVVERSHTGAVYTPECVGEDWQDPTYLQLLLQPNVSLDLNSLLDPDLYGPTSDIASATSSGRTSQSDP